MKLYYLILILLLLPIVNAEIYRDSYSSGETFQAEINLNVEPIDEIKIDNFKILDSEDKKVSVPLFFIEVYEGSYFVYFIPNLEDGNYKLVLDNILYVEDSVTKKTNYTEEFKIENKDNVLSVNPGGFKLDIKKDDKLLEYDLDFSGDVEVQDLEGFEYEDSLVIDSSKIESGRKDLIVKYNGLQYKIPFFITKEEEIGIPIAFIEEFDSIDMDLLYNDTKVGYLKFQNVLNRPLYDLSFELTGNLYEIIKLKSEGIKYLGSGKLGRAELMINEDKKEEAKDYSGDFIVSGNEFSVSMPINISVKYTPEEIIFEEPTFTEEPKKKDYTKVYIALITIGFILIVYFLIRLKLGKGKKQGFMDYVESLKK